jgi:hypothetical protein
MRPSGFEGDTRLRAREDARRSRRRQSSRSPPAQELSLLTASHDESCRLRAKRVEPDDGAVERPVVRRLVTRYENRLENYSAFVHVACMLIAYARFETTSSQAEFFQIQHDSSHQIDQHPRSQARVTILRHDLVKILAPVSIAGASAAPYRRDTSSMSRWSSTVRTHDVRILNLPLTMRAETSSRATRPI